MLASGGHAPWPALVVALLLAACSGDDGGGDGGGDARTANDDASVPLGDGGGPPGDGRCRITRNLDRHTALVAMTDDAREVNVELAEYSVRYLFDERGLWVRAEYTGVSDRAPGELTYDAQGTLVSAQSFGAPGDTCDNTYDADGLLGSRQCSQGSYTYHHDAAGRIDQFSVTPPGAAPGAEGERTFEVGYDGDGTLPVAVEDADSLYTYAYDADGRMNESLRDWVFGGARDGTFDVRWSWERRAGGGVRAYAQDGTDHADAPVIDGVPDLVWAFDEACDPLTLAHPWLGGEPTVIDVGRPMPPFPL